MTFFVKRQLKRKGSVSEYHLNNNFKNLNINKNIQVRMTQIDVEKIILEEKEKFYMSQAILESLAE